MFCRSTQRVSRATSAVIGVLKKYPQAWLSRQTAKETAKKRIGDTNLLDYVLKNLADVGVGKQVVRGNEYNQLKLEDIRNTAVGSRQKSDAVGACSSEPDDVESGKQTTESDVPVPDSTGVADTKDSILRDLVHLYLYVLGNFDLHENARVAANGAPSTQDNSKHSHQNLSSAKSGKRPGLDVLVHRILDGKLFVKEYTSERLLLKKSLDQQQSIGVHDRRGDDLSGGNTVLCALQFEKGNPCWQTTPII